MTNDDVDFRRSALRSRLISVGCNIVEKDSVVEPEATRRWNRGLNTRPLLVARCSTTMQVSEALRAARETGVMVSVHNGGQDWALRSLRDDSLVIDLSSMTTISIDSINQEATIGGGVTAKQINEAAGEQGFAAAISNDGAVGMAGLILGGGYGPLMPSIGLACDNLISAEVVLPSGEVMACDADNNADLFWALRGGGGNFGVVTSARIRLHRVETVLAGTIVFPWVSVRVALSRYNDLMRRAPQELFGAAVLSLGPGGRPVTVITLIWTGEPAKGKEVINEVGAEGSPLMVKAEQIQASELLSLTDGKLPQGRGYEVATRWLETLGAETIEAIVSAFEGRSSPLSSIIVHHCHGVAAEVEPEATAFGMREPHFTALIYAAWTPESDDGDPHRRWARDLSIHLASAALPGGYANLLPDDAADQIAHAFGLNAARLTSLKKSFDPWGALRAIPLPLGTDREEPYVAEA